jgi:hypothetical protein
MGITKTYFSISPINNNAVRSDAVGKISGGFSHRGSPTIRFSMPNIANMVDSKALRLTGQYMCKTSNDDVLLVATTNIDENNDTTLARATSANISNFGGMQNAIDSLVIQSKKSKIELSNNVSYATNASLLDAYRNEVKDYAYGSESNQSLAQGYDAVHSNRLYNLSANYDTNGNGGFELSPTDKNIGQHFSIQIEDSMFQSDVYIGDDGIQGMNITIHLSPDSSFFHQRYRSVGTAQNEADITNIQYILRNLKLEGRYIVPNKDDLAQYKPQKMLQNRLLFLNDVRASDSTFNYTPQLSACKSIYHLFTDDNQKNNLGLQENNYKPPIGLESCTQMMNSLRFPCDFIVSSHPHILSTPRSNPNNILGTLGDVQNTTNKSDLVGDVEHRWHMNKAVTGNPYSKNAYNLNAVNISMREDYTTLNAGDADNGYGSNMHPLMTGIGSDYGFDVINNTVNYQDQDYSIHIKSGIQSGLDVFPEMSKNRSVNVKSYIKHISVLDTVKLVKTM